MVTLCTNIVDLYSEEIADLYRLRWSIETFFKTLKPNFQIKNIFGTSRNAVFSQAIIAFLVCVVISALYSFSVEHNLFPRRKSLNFTDFFHLFKSDDLPFPISRASLCIFYEYSTPMRLIRSLLAVIIIYLCVCFINLAHT